MWEVVPGTAEGLCSCGCGRGTSWGVLVPPVTVHFPYPTADPSKLFLMILPFLSSILLFILLQGEGKVCECLMEQFSRNIKLGNTIPKPQHWGNLHPCAI